MHVEDSLARGGPGVEYQAVLAAAVFIGYHASEMTTDAVRGHTFSTAKLLGVSRPTLYDLMRNYGLHA